MKKIAYRYEKIISWAILFLGYFLIPSTSHAQVIQNPLQGFTSVPQFISSVLNDVVEVGGVIAIFAFVYAGYRYVKAQGEPAEITKAHKIFIDTCIGVAILLGAQILASIIVGTVKNLQS